MVDNSRVKELEKKIRVLEERRLGLEKDVSHLLGRQKALEGTTAPGSPTANK